MERRPPSGRSDGLQAEGTKYRQKARTTSRRHRPQRGGTTDGRRKARRLPVEGTDCQWKTHCGPGGRRDASTCASSIGAWITRVARAVEDTARFPPVDLGSFELFRASAWSIGPWSRGIPRWESRCLCAGVSSSSVGVCTIADPPDQPDRLRPLLPTQRWASGRGGTSRGVCSTCRCSTGGFAVPSTR